MLMYRNFLAVLMELSICLACQLMEEYLLIQTIRREHNMVLGTVILSVLVI